MKNVKTLIAGLVLAICGVFNLIPAQADGIGSSSSETEVKMDPISGDITVTIPSRSAGRETQEVCTFRTLASYVHTSNSEPGWLHAHGAWQSGTCAGFKARVTVQIQRAEPGDGFKWFSDVGSQGDSILSASTDGMKSGFRSVARYSCNGNKKYVYRSWVDVDLIGAADDPTKKWSPEVELYCG